MAFGRQRDVPHRDVAVHVHVDEDPDTIVADFKRRASQAPTLRSGKLCLERQ